MGKLILCHGNLALKPYQFALTNTNIYSIEEIAYYIFHNIYAIYEDTFTKELALWIEEELKLPETAQKLNNLIDNKNSLKDIVVTLLCASDYYGEAEIKEIIQIIDETRDLEPIRRRKIKADHLLKYKNYQLAEAEYMEILNSDDANLLREEEIGDILHNQAIIKLHTASIKEASSMFKEAYDHNHDEETLKEYFYTLKLGNYEEDYQKEIINYNLDSEILFEMNGEWNECLNTMTESSSYQKFKQIMERKEEGNFTIFYKEIDNMINIWKKEFRGN